MNLFSDTDEDILEFDDEQETDPAPKRKKKAPNPFNNLRLRLDLYKQFALAIRERDKQVLHFLLSDNQESKDWESKQDFIDKYLKCCTKFESEQKIIITTQEGFGFDNGSQRGFYIGIAVIVDSAATKERLWRFDLVFGLDNIGKLKVNKCKRSFISTSFYVYVRGKRVRDNLAVSLLLPLG